jgi:type IV pilus assembly protein PilA
MIVVAIIGILAAVAIPAYSDYTARAQVSEAVSLTSSLKTPLMEWISDNNSLPAGPTSVGGTETGKYVDAITFGGTSTAPVIIATFKSTGVNNKLTNSVFAISSNDQGKSWLCDATAGTDISTSLLPGACK